MPPCVMAKIALSGQILKFSFACLMEKSFSHGILRIKYFISQLTLMTTGYRHKTSLEC